MGLCGTGLCIPHSAQLQFPWDMPVPPEKQMKPFDACFEPFTLFFHKLNSRFALQVAGRMLKYSYYIARVSHFIASKMQSAVTKNMVFPSCTDIPLPPLLPLDHRFAAAAIPAFLGTGTLIAWPDRCSRKTSVACIT